MATLFLIRGIPGSGKSTLAEMLVASGAAEYAFEADQWMINSSGDYEFNARNLAHCHRMCQESTINALESGSSVIVSNTSTTEREVAEYQRIAEKTGAKFVSLICENRHGGSNVHSVPEDKLKAMRNRFSVKI